MVKSMCCSCGRTGFCSQYQPLPVTTAPGTRTVLGSMGTSTHVCMRTLAPVKNKKYTDKAAVVLDGFSFWKITLVHSRQTKEPNLGTI